MTTVRERLGRAYAGWERWWFTPRETSTLAVIRIVFGIVVFLWTASQATTLLTFLGSRGIVPHGPDYDASSGGWSAWSVLTWFPGDGTVIALFVVMLIAAAAVTIGWRPRIWALVVFIGMLSMERRDPYVYNAGDVLLRLMALYLALSPCGEALSLDRWRRRRDEFWAFRARRQWALRLMQIQVSLVYLDSVWAKVRGVHWNDGTAVSIALRIGDLHRFPVPHFLLSSQLFANLLTFSALATEFALGTLIWNRRARPYVLLAGVGLHLGIDWAITVGFFSYTVFLFYLSFVEPASMRRFVLGARDLVRRRGAALSRRPANVAAARAASAADQP